MRSIILLGLCAILSISTATREFRSERKYRPQKFSLIPFKDKRGTGDYIYQSSNGGSGGGSSGGHSFFTPVNSPISNQVLGASAGGLSSLGQSSSGHGLTFGSSGLSFAALGLNAGHGGGGGGSGASSGQSYALPFQLASNSLYSSPQPLASKNGPVTFGPTHQIPSYMSSLFTSGSNSLPVFNLGVHRVSPSSLSSGGGLSGYTISQEPSSLPSHDVSGDLIISNNQHQIPVSSSYSYSGSHSSYPSPSEESQAYSTSGANSAYNYPTSTSSNGYASSLGSSSSSSISSSSNPSTLSSYSYQPSTSDSLRQQQTSNSLSYSSQPTTSYNSVGEQQTSYSQLNPMLLNYLKSLKNAEGPKYDTISYSSP